MSNIDWGGREPEVYRNTSTPRRSPTSTIRSQLSSGSANTLSRRLSGAAGRVAGEIGGAYNTANPSAARQVSGVVPEMARGLGRGLGDYNRNIDQAIRSNPYGGVIGEDEQAGGRYTGFKGYYGETEFEVADPFGRPEARFYPGDARAILNGMDGTVVARIQERLKHAGFIEGGYAEGAVLPETVNAFSDLLAESNRRGTTWGRTLGDIEKMMEEMGLDEDERAPFLAPTYVAPDYAKLAQDVKGQMRQALGRDPDESELAQLTAELDGWYQAQYDEEVEAARREYEMAEEGGVPEAGRGVDPEARFKEMFETRYAPGIKNEKMKEEVVSQQGLVQGGVSTLSQMAGGMG